jgi:hypothetical protein
MILAGGTNDGRTTVIVYWPVAAFREVRTDVERHFVAALDLVPDLAERVRCGTRAERFRGTADRFLGTVVGTVPIPEFFSPENLGRIIGGAHAAAA